MAEPQEIGKLYQLFYNRLKITVARTGLTMMQDLRDRRSWMEEMLRWNETAVFEEIDEEVSYPSMLKFMEEHGWSDGEREYWFKVVTGKELAGGMV